MGNGKFELGQRITGTVLSYTDFRLVLDSYVRLADVQLDDGTRRTVSMDETRDMPREGERFEAILEYPEFREDGRLFVIGDNSQRPVLSLGDARPEGPPSRRPKPPEGGWFPTLFAKLGAARLKL